MESGRRHAMLVTGWRPGLALVRHPSYYRWSCSEPVTVSFDPVRAELRMAQEFPSAPLQRCEGRGAASLSAAK